MSFWDVALQEIDSKPDLIHTTLFGIIEVRLGHGVDVHANAVFPTSFVKSSQYNISTGYTPTTPDEERVQSYKTLSAGSTPANSTQHCTHLADHDTINTILSMRYYQYDIISTMLSIRYYQYDIFNTLSIRYYRCIFYDKDIPYLRLQDATQEPVSCTSLSVCHAGSTLQKSRDIHTTLLIL